MVSYILTILQFRLCLISILNSASDKLITSQVNTDGATTDPGNETALSEPADDGKKKKKKKKGLLCSMHFGSTIQAYI